VVIFEINLKQIFVGASFQNNMDQTKKKQPTTYSNNYTGEN